MKVGDLVYYRGNLGIILNKPISIDNTYKHWHVWFFDSEAYIIVYESLMQKYEKILDNCYPP